MLDIEKVYKQYSSTVYKYLFCLTRDSDISEDLTQETFAIAVEKINKFRGECKVSVWLCQIAKNLWFKERKKSRNMSVENNLDILEDNLTPEKLYLKKEEKMIFYKNLQKLDELSREIVYLRMMGNLNFIEIGEILGKTPNCTRVIFYRAKQKLKEENSDE